MCLRKQLLSLLEGRGKVFRVKGRARVRTLGQEGGSVAQSRTKGRLVWLAEGEGTLTGLKVSGGTCRSLPPEAGARPRNEGEISPFS